jgi:glycosyltransferase involved in cell wall biosynthesis
MTKKYTMRPRKPTVSVIMPVYNAGKFLVRAIESIQKQTMDHLEFLIIDDNSSDNSWDIIKHYAKRDKRIRVFRNTKNLGLVASLNFILPKTHGTYIARMDADDISLPERFAKQIALLEGFPNLVACGGQEYIINERGRTIAEKYFPTDETACYNLITNIMVIQPPLLMARGEIMRKLKYDNHIFKNDDISMHFKLLKYGGFSNVDEIIFKYRKRPDSLTHKHPKQVFYRALLVRINAIRKHNFAPPVLNLLILAAEALIVGIMPEKLVTSSFEFLRYMHHGVKQVFKFGLSFPTATFAKAASMILWLNSFRNQ